MFFDIICQILALRRGGFMNSNSEKKVRINYSEIIKHPVISLKRLLHPIFLNMMPGRRNFDLKYINEKPEIEGPVLYLVTHSNSHDAPIASEALVEHFYILVGKQPLELLDNIFFNANGKIEVDRDDKKDGIKAAEKMTKLLKNGVDVVMYPERTWCTKPSTPINHCRWGWVDIAKETNVTVVPVALEYYELTDNCCYINYGKPFKVNANDSKEEKNNELEEIFATLKYEIWNQFPIQKRSEIDPTLWDKVMEHRYSEYPKLDKEKEKTYVAGWQSDPEYVLSSPGYLIGIQKLEDIYGDIAKKSEKSR